MTDRGAKYGVVLIALGVWAGLIFATSSTVIRPDEFFRLVARTAGAGPETMQKFVLFWGLSWFAIVKSWHVTEFAVLTYLTALLMGRWFGSLTNRSIIIAMLICATYAGLDEWHQTFVPERFGTVQDVLIDCLGICLAGTLLIRRTNRSECEKPATNAECIVSTNGG